MSDKIIFVLIIFIFSFTVNAQEISVSNSDIIYTRALEEYRNKAYPQSLQLTRHGLELAPEYHDIRMLQVRILWALKDLIAADIDLDYLLEEAPEYVDVKPLVYQRISKFENPKEALNFIEELNQFYPGDTELQIWKSQMLLKDNQRKKARSLATELISQKDISGANRYILQNILTRTVSDEIGLNYQYINFSSDYARNKSWNSISAEYQHNFKRTAVIGRVNYADRNYDQAILYELEAYPVISNRLYAFTNIGVSDGTMFPDVITSASLFYNFAKIFEAEAGGRMLFFNSNSYFTGIFGLTVYQGKFYLNGRTFIGPERRGNLVQNYQANVRYYFKNSDNYVFFRLGSGISPDERTIFTQVQENPALEAYYGNLGINKTIGIHHIFQLGAGLLFEDISAEDQGNQFIGNLGYRYRF